MCLGGFKRKSKTDRTSTLQTDVQLPDMQLYKLQNSPRLKQSMQISQSPQSQVVPHYDDRPVTGNFEFTLTEFGDNIPNGFREIENPTEEQLKNAVKNLIDNNGDFFTLISSEPIKGYTLIGGAVSFGETLPTASVQVEAGNKNGKRIEKSYDKLVSPTELLNLMTKFMDGHTPDIRDGSWIFDEDIEFPD